MDGAHPAPSATVSTPQVWYGRDMAKQPESWNRHWSSDEIAEIEAAIAAVEAKALDILDIDAAAFPLPTIAPEIERIRQTVLHGPGIFLLRGLPVSQWTVKQAAIAFWGLGAHMGDPCSQNGKGHVLGHVKNLGLDYAAAATRGYQTSARLPYHTDSSDIVGLLCLKTAQSGGLSSVVSSTTVYYEVLKRRPDLMPVLMQPFYRTRWGEIPEGKMPWAEVPVFMPHEGRVISHYVRSAIRKGQDLLGAPQMTELQIEALDLVDSIAADPDVHLDMTFEPGDIQLVCNHGIYHSRTAYEDWPEPADRRHLLRLWLACTDGPPLPDWMTVAYEGQTATGRPNGIAVPGVPFVAPLEAE